MSGVGTEQPTKAYFESVFGNSMGTGLVSEKSYDNGTDCVFEAVQTLRKDHQLNKIPRDYFDACVYDEEKTKEEKLENFRCLTND